MAKKLVLLDEELSIILSEHAVGRLMTGYIADTGERTCALGAAAQLYEWADNEDAYSAFARAHKSEAYARVYRPFDRRYRVKMTPEQVLGIWPTDMRAAK